MLIKPRMNTTSNSPPVSVTMVGIARMKNDVARMKDIQLTSPLNKDSNTYSALSAAGSGGFCCSTLSCGASLFNFSLVGFSFK